MYMYDPANMSWTDLSHPLKGTPPSPRWGHGFAEVRASLPLAGSELYTPEVNESEILKLIIQRMIKRTSKIVKMLSDPKSAISLSDMCEEVQIHC